jgi:parvulin-like peptidyl-prolyl isomerase
MLLGVAALLLSRWCAAQEVKGEAHSTTASTADATQGVVLDRVVAVVNGDVILESDVEEERRLAAFQPFRDSSRRFSREEAMSRLVDRALILQQEKLQPQQPVTDKDIDDQFAALRREIPACKQYHCETDEGWKKFVEAQGFTLDELRARWRQRMEVLRFIEQRFRSGIHISDDEIKGYYDETLLPEFARQKAKPPALAEVSDRIQEILLQQQVGALLVDWLKTLRAQGSVQILEPGEVMQ